MLLILQGSPRGERALNRAGPQGLKPPCCPYPEEPFSQPNLPLAPQHAQPTSTSPPSPSSVTQTHPLFSLLLCAIPSLSLHFLKVARARLFSLVLFTSFCHSFSLLCPVHPHLHKTTCRAFSKLCLKTLFSFLPFYWVLHSLTPVSGVCTAACARSPVSCSLPRGSPETF